MFCTVYYSIADGKMVPYRHELQKHGIIQYAEDGNVQFIDHVDILALLIEHCLAYDVAVHCPCQGVPGTKVFPGACKAHDLDLRLMLHHGIVEADFIEGVILIEQVLIVHKINEFINFCFIFHHNFLILPC